MSAKTLLQPQAMVVTDANPSVASLVLNLSSKSFDVRQSAAEQLWAMGPEAKESLIKAIDSADFEVRRRLESIVDAMDIVGPNEVSPGVLRAVLFFKSGESGVKNQVIVNLLENNEFQLAFELVNRVKDPSLRNELVRANIDVAAIVFGLAHDDRWSDIDFVLTHPIAWETNQPIAIYYAQVTGQIAGRISEYKRMVEQGTASQDEHLHLITLFRVQRDIDSAMAYARQLKSSVVKYPIINNLLMERGEWRTVLDRLEIVDAPVPAHGKAIPATLAQKALCYSFLGERESVTETIQHMRTKFAERKVDSEQSQSADSQREHIVDTLLACLEFDQAKTLLASEPKKQMAFNLLSFTQRSDEALELVGLAGDFEHRLDWIKQTGIRLTKLAQESKKKGSYQLSDEFAYEFELAMSVARQLGNLGYFSEATLHFRTIADAIGVDDENAFGGRSLILEELAEIGAYDEAWRLVTRKFKKREYWYLSQSLFGNSFPTADYWYRKLESRFPDVHRRIIVVAQLVDSPLAQAAAKVTGGQTLLSRKDLFQIVESIDTSGVQLNPGDQRGDADYHLAMTHFYLDDLAGYQRHLRQSASLGRVGSMDELAVQAEISENWDAAADLLDRIWKQDRQPHNAMRAAIAYQKLNDIESSKRRKIVAMAAWQISYETNAMLQLFQNAQIDTELSEILNVIIYGMNSDATAADFYRGVWANAIGEMDPKWAAANLKISLFERFNSSVALGSRLGTANLARTANLTSARAEIEKGKIDVAIEMLDRAHRFRPGEVDIAETHVPMLSRLGYSSEADSIFGKVSSFYTTLFERHPDSPIHNNNFAWACVTSQRQMKRALEHAVHATELMPNNSSYLDTLAEIEFRNGHVQRAKELSRKCLKINPKLNYRRQFMKFSQQQE